MDIPTSATHFIYKTTNLINGKIYVGQRKIYSGYVNYLGSGTAINNAINKYGKENFKRDVLEYCIFEDVDRKEISWIDKLDARNKQIGYNIALGGLCGSEDMKLSQEHIQKLIEANTGRTHTPEELEKMRQANIGRKHTKETKDKLRKLSLGRISPNKGMHMSQEQKEKLRISRTGTKQSEETIMKKRLKATGKIRTKETKEKMSLVRKKYWELKKLTNNKS